MSVEVKTIVAAQLFAGGYGRASALTEDDRISICFDKAEDFMAEALRREAEAERAWLEAANPEPRPDPTTAPSSGAVVREG